MVYPLKHIIDLKLITISLTLEQLLIKPINNLKPIKLFFGVVGWRDDPFDENFWCSKLNTNFLTKNELIEGCIKDYTKPPSNSGNNGYTNKARLYSWNGTNGGFSVKLYGIDCKFENFNINNHSYSHIMTNNSNNDLVGYYRFLDDTNRQGYLFFDEYYENYSIKEGDTINYTIDLQNKKMIFYENGSVTNCKISNSITLPPEMNYLPCLYLSDNAKNVTCVVTCKTEDVVENLNSSDQ